MEERYQGRWDAHMMSDYCWTLICDCAGQSDKRKSYKRTNLLRLVRLNVSTMQRTDSRNKFLTRENTKMDTNFIQIDQILMR